MKIGFVGVGNMAGAILEGALKAGAIAPEDAFVFDVNAEKVAALEAKWGIHACVDNAALAQCCDLLLLGVKPNVASAVLAELSDKMDGKAAISIVTGFSTQKLQASLTGARVLRVMPNTPALFGEGVFSLSKSHTLNEAECAFARKLFEALGTVLWIDESMMEAATGVMGSGPAYVFLFIEAMADGGVFEGLPRAVAYQMAAQTVLGSAKMVLESGRHPGDLKDMVCSPGGTTIEAVRVLEENGLRAAVMDAVIAATEKARQMKS